jgi:hypothetical protein
MKLVENENRIWDWLNLKFGHQSDESEGGQIKGM